MDSMPVFQPRVIGLAKSNAERQREFRERHPGYYQRLHAQRRAHIKALLAARRAAIAVPQVVARREPLMLPAPVEAIEIPGINVISRELPAREAVLVEVRRAERPMTVAQFFEMDNQ